MAYMIEQGCSGCGMCIEVCPRRCIDDEQVPHRIDAERCVECGVCEQECPLDVIASPSAAALR